MATFFNQATLSYNGNVINSNITTGELLEVLSATKTAVIDSYAQGSIITYVVNIVNSGTLAYNALTVTDDLGEYTFGGDSLVPLTYIEDSINYFINGIPQTSPAVTAGPPLVISGINIPAGAVATIIYAARANGYAPLDPDAAIVNTATISGGGITPISATETVTAQSDADLNIFKSLSPTTVTENGTLTYTFVIQNTGSTEIVATDDAVITDIFDPVLNDITVTFNGTVWTEGTNYTYNETTGAFESLPGSITVPAATYTQDPTTGVWLVEPGTSTLVITGTV